MNARACLSGNHRGVGRSRGKAIFDAAGFSIYLLAGAVARDDILESGIAQGESQLGEKVQVGANGRADEGKKDSHGLAVQSPEIHLLL